MRRAGAIVGLLLALAPAAHAQTEAEQRARYERGRAQQSAFEHGRFGEAGFASIAEAEAEGRVVRRVLLRDPYGMIAMPGIELERLADGRVTVRLQYRRSNALLLNPVWSTDPVEVEPGAWDELAALEQPLFTPPAFRFVPPGLQPPRPSQHDWAAWFEAGRERSAAWSQCGGINHPGYRYAARAAELAVGSKPGCEFARGDPFWSFNRCFSLTSPLDDPALEAAFATLRKEYDEAPGSERLAEARRALQAPGLALGNQAWLDARAAIGRLRDVNRLRQERLNLVSRLFYATPNLSVGDRAKLQYTIDNWSQFLRSQDANYAEVLQRLAWPDGPPAAP
jgi:hypothetical protein